MKVLPHGRSTFCIPYKHSQLVCLIEELRSLVSVGKGDVAVIVAMGYFYSLEEP